MVPNNETDAIIAGLNAKLGYGAELCSDYRELREKQRTGTLSAAEQQRLSQLSQALITAAEGTDRRFGRGFNQLYREHDPLVDWRRLRDEKYRIGYDRLLPVVQQAAKIGAATNTGTDEERRERALQQVEDDLNSFVVGLNDPAAQPTTPGAETMPLASIMHPLHVEDPARFIDVCVTETEKMLTQRQNGKNCEPSDVVPEILVQIIPDGPKSPADNIKRARRKR